MLYGEYAAAGGDILRSIMVGGRGLNIPLLLLSGGSIMADLRKLPGLKPSLNCLFHSASSA